MRLVVLTICVFLPFRLFSQDGISLEKVIKADFDANGFEDIAYYTQEKTNEFNTVQIELYFMNDEGIEKEIKTEKLIFNKSATEIDSGDITCFSFAFEETNLSLIFRKNHTTCYWWFVYNDKNFELLYYAESLTENEHQKFHFLNLKEGKITISNSITESNEWDTRSSKYTIVDLPTLQNFKGYEVKWPK